MEGMGYSSRDAQLLAAPPFVFAAIFTFALAIVIDRKRSFAPFIVFPACVAIIGLCMVCFLVRYSQTNLLSFLSYRWPSIRTTRFDTPVFFLLVLALPPTHRVSSAICYATPQVNRSVHSRPLSPSAEVVLVVLLPPLSSALRTPLATDPAVSDRSPTHLGNALIVYLSVDRHWLSVGHHTCLWYPHCLVLSPQQASAHRHQAYRRSPGLLLYLLNVEHDVE
jgi:hypothetical protein